MDLVRHEACSAQRWTDGERYCTPAVAEAVFADSQCLTLVARVAISSTIKYAAARGIDDYIAKVYPLGERFAGTSALAWKLQQGQCVGPFADSTIQLFQLGPAETSDAFARLRRTTAAGNSRVRVVYETSDDGLRAPVTFFDTHLSIECDADQVYDALTALCIPVLSVPATYFGDAACTLPVAGVSTIRMPDAIESHMNGCREYHAVGQEAFRLWTAGTCSEIPLPAGARYVGAGKVLDLTSLPHLKRVGTRISLIGLDEHELDAVDRFVHDSDIDADCIPTQRSDGLRCIPPHLKDVWIVQRFQFADCTTPITVAYVPTAECESSPSFVSDADGSLRHVGQAHVGPLYEQIRPGVCAVVTSPLGTVPHPVGDRIPDTMFASVAVGYITSE